MTEYGINELTSLEDADIEYAQSLPPVRKLWLTLLASYSSMACLETGLTPGQEIMFYGLRPYFPRMFQTPES